MRNVHILAFGNTVCGKDWGIHRETPIFCRVYFPRGGICRYQDSQCSQILKHETLYFFPQYKNYSMEQDTDDPFDVLWQHIQIEGVFLSALVSFEILRDTPEMYILEALRQISEIPAVTGKPQQSRERIHQLEKLLQALISLLEEKSGSFVSEADPRLACAWGEFDKKKSVAEMASAAGMERSYFSRQFRRQFGISPQQWQLEARLDLAAQHLLEGATVADAAEIAGYADVKAFARAFRSKLKSAPSEYRKNHKVQP